MDSELFSKYVLFTDRTEEENQAFQEYILNLTKKFSLVTLIGIFLLILFTWPSDYLLYENQDLLHAYFWWRTIGLGSILCALICYFLFDSFNKNFTLIIYFGSVAFTLWSGYIFGTAKSFRSPWFSIIYSLPFITLLMPLKLQSRFVFTLVLPAAYFSGFLILNPIEEFPQPGMQAAGIFSACSMAIIIGHGIYLILRQNYFQSIELEEERKKSDELLHNTLPEPIVERLKSGEDVSDRFDEVTVLFADLVEFTPLADELPPEEVVDLLDGIFSSFDDLTEEHGVEKIKTIGDEYFVAAGVPESADDHAVKCAQYALAMQDVVNEYTRHDDKPFELRIGMNTGSLVAGVIGNKRFVYDVWGDIVNVGSRMESQGEPGNIQVTPATKQAIEEEAGEGEFEFEERGPIDVKGKDRMTTYFLSRKASH